MKGDVPIYLGKLTKAFLKISYKFRWLSGILLKFNPRISRWIAQNRMKIDPEDYMFVGFLTSLLFFLLGVLAFTVYLIIINASIEKSLYLILLVGFAPASFVWMDFVTYPQRLAFKKGKRIERKLSFGIRELIIEVKSGVPIYNAIKNIAFGRYGELSEEFKKIVADVESGKSLVNALEDSALRIESKFYKSMIWAIISSLRAGTDVSEALVEILKALEEEQKLALKRYAQSLNPLILMYMMISVIFPILLITLMIIMGAMGQIVFSRNHLFMIWFLIASMNILFITTVRNKRPSVIG